MAQIKIVDPINAAIEARQVPQASRGYLGVSQLGHECKRHLWYVLHDAPRDPVSPRTERIWKRGDWEEQRIIDDLISIGCKVWGEQKEISLLGGKVKGHIDGIVLGVPGAEKTEHLLEIKTMNDASWKKFHQFGMKQSNPQYWMQAQVYAYMLKLSRILFACVNKNDEARRFERAEVDPNVYQEAEQKAIDIVGAQEIPPKIWDNPAYFACKFCAYKGICHDAA